MRRVLTITLLVVLLSSLVSPPLSAQPPAELSRADSALGELEKTITAIQQRNSVGADVDLDSDFDQYAALAAAAFLNTFSAVQQEAKAKRDAGSLGRLKTFESQITSHRARTEKMLQQLTAVATGISQGSITVEAGQLRGASDEDLTRMKDFLTPQARQKYRAIEPRLSSVDTPRLLSLFARPPAANQTIREACQLPGTSSAFGTIAGLWTVPQAEAAIGSACYAICAASFGLGCIACIAGGTASTVAAYNSYVDSRNHCGSCKWYKPWACLCRAAALAAFLAKLA